MISQQREIQIGRQAARQARLILGLVDDRTLQQYVGRIGRRLASKTERPDLPWSFAVVDDPTPNAFALPGGFIFVTRAMMNLLTSEAELASILGHEIAHVTERHALNQISKEKVAQLGVGLGGILVPEVEPLSPGIGAGFSILFAKYTRNDESEADELGYQYAHRAGYDVSEVADVFEALERVSDDSAGALPGWLSTHPSPVERIQTAMRRAERIGSRPETIVGSEAYLRQIDGLVYGQDPRNGFFRESVFYQPKLRFQVRFPQGWQTRTLARAVAGVSPHGAAAFQLTLAEGSREHALQRFRRQGGVLTGQPSWPRINGLDATIAQFITDTDEGGVRGIAAFVQYRGRTYQMLAYAERFTYGSMAPELMGIIQSFAAVSDVRIPYGQPHRIDVVKLDRSQTLQEFVRRYFSVVPVERLAVLNQLPSGSIRMEAGSLVKRVVS